MYQVWAKFRALGFARCDWCPTFVLSGQASAAHQTGCVLAANVNALADQHAPYLPHVVDAEIFSINIANMLHESSVAKTAGT